jgi:hypothetical protein
MKTIWLINWDNGGDACGTFPWEYDTQEAAQADADSIEAENLAQDIWAEDGCCEVISIERDDNDPDDDLDEEAQYHADRNRFADPNR